MCCVFLYSGLLYASIPVLVAAGVDHFTNWLNMRLAVDIS